MRNIFRVAPVAALAAMAGFATAAKADATYYIDGTFGSATLNLVLTTTSTLNGAGGYDILSASGSLTGSGYDGSIVSLVSNPNQPGTYTFTGNPGGTYFTFDNDWFKTGQHLDDWGIVFKLSNGLYATLWGNSATDYELFIGDWLFDAHGDPAIAVPEPSSLALFGSALLALGGLYFSRRRSKKQASSLAAA